MTVCDFMRVLWCATSWLWSLCRQQENNPAHNSLEVTVRNIFSYFCTEFGKLSTYLSYIFLITLVSLPGVWGVTSYQSCLDLVFGFLHEGHSVVFWEWSQNWEWSNSPIMCLGCYSVTQAGAFFCSHISLGIRSVVWGFSSINFLCVLHFPV